MTAKKQTTLLIIVLLSVALSSGAFGQTYRYVVASNAGAQAPYTNWVEAAATIQDAVDVASAGEIIMVGPGTYDEGGKPASGNLLTNRVMVPVALTIRAQSTDPAETVIRGKWHEGYPGGATTNPCGNAAVRGVWLANGAQLHGFTIEGGATRLATTSAEIGVEHYGGGILCGGASTLISNCVVSANTAFAGGGGVYQGVFVDSILINNTHPLRPSGLARQNTEGGGAGRSAKFIRCKLSENTTWNNGGAGYACTFEHSTLSNNVAVNNGGGMHSGSATNCVIIGNTARYGGGTDWSTVRESRIENNASAWVGGTSSSTLFGCLVAGNTGTSEAGGMAGGTAYNCVITNNTGIVGGARSATLYNCRVVRNSGGNSAGGMSLGTAYNSLFVGNRITTYWGAGGGAREATLYNCTVVGNQASNGGGGVYKGTTYNSIVVGNVSTRNGDNYDDAAVFHTSCTVPAKDGWSAGNIAETPRLTDPGSGYGFDHVFGDYRLHQRSPCVDKGQPFDWMTDPQFAGDIRLFDLDGDIRIQPVWGAVDLGAYETLPLPRGTVIVVR